MSTRIDSMTDGGWPVSTAGSAVVQDDGAIDRISVTMADAATALNRHAAAWNSLLRESAVDTVFLRSEWLRACCEVFGADGGVVLPMVHMDGRLVAAAAFQVVDRQVSFLGQERADYCDVIISETLDDALAARVVDALLEAVLRTTSPQHAFSLRRVPARSRFRRLLDAGRTRFHSTVKNVIEAPVMDMAVVADKVRKKSLKRHENGLKRSGDLRFETATDAASILPDLDEFFAQHVSRWSEQGSLFEDDTNREFYRRMILEFDGTGVLQFSRLTLDGALIAAHLGFLHDGSFVWYKPTFDVALSRKSPGEVLLKRTLEHARDVGAREFDFTIGDESYKARFATEVRQVFDLHVTGSRFEAGVQRLRTRVKHLLAKTRAAEQRS